VLKMLGEYTFEVASSLEPSFCDLLNYIRCLKLHLEFIIIQFSPLIRFTIKYRSIYFS
jgi:hypothetical protein